MQDTWQGDRGQTEERVTTSRKEVAHLRMLGAI